VELRVEALQTAFGPQPFERMRMYNPAVAWHHTLPGDGKAQAPELWLYARLELANKSGTYYSCPVDRLQRQRQA
jgi:hypothetical protein